MGIIAGIAIPTTIAVINRQKRNAATKSAENAFTAAKNVLLEASTGTLPTVDDANEGVTKSVEDDTTTYSVTTTGLVAMGELEKDIVESGTLTFQLSGTNNFSADSDNAKINGYIITWNATNGFKAE